MTLLEEIQTKCTPELIASREHGQIAAVVSEGRTELRERMIGKGTILNYCDNGSQILEDWYQLAQTRQNLDLTWGWDLLVDWTLDVANSKTRAMLDAFLPAETYGNAASTLKALAEYPAPVSTQDVIRAMEGM